MVEAVGAAVTRFQPGDEVYGTGKGTFAELVAVTEGVSLTPKPASLTFEEAAAVRVAGLTALQALRDKGSVQPGHEVLINGAAGGVGTFTVQIAKSMGAHVTAVCSTKNVDLVSSLGADEVVDYTKTDWSKWAVEKYGKPQRRSYEGGVDVVVNFTGGDTWVPSLRCVKRGGKILVCGATAGYDPKEDLRYVWSFEIEIKGSNSFYDEDLASLMTMIREGKIKPVIDKVLPLDQAAEGLRLIQDREVIGKVVVTP